MKIRVALMLIGLLMALLLSELILRAFYPQKLNGRWRMLDQEGLFINCANCVATHYVNDSKVKYRFNDYHMRGPNPDFTKNHKVLLLGDSFTFGWGVKEDLSLAGIYNEKAKKCDNQSDITFLNGSAGGWGMSDYLDFYERYANFTNYSSVVLVVNFDDLNRSIKSNLYALENMKLKRNDYKKSVATKWIETIRYNKFYSYLLENMHIIQLIRNFYIQTTTNKSNFNIEKLNEIKQMKSNDNELQLGIALLNRFLTITKERNAKLHIITTGFHVLYKESIDYKFLKKIKVFSKINNIPFLDLTKSFGRLLKSDYHRFTIKKDGHPNELALLTIANYTWPLISQGICIRDAK